MLLTSVFIVVCLQDSELSSVQDAVSCLAVSELKMLAKSLQINVSSLKKHEIADAVVRHSRRPNVSSFFTCASDATEKMVLKRFVCDCLRHTDKALK